ncbi:hypothetical protein [Streptomyces sp. NPDC002564]|uniref:hypothetical protein n=1 Tax=Streptomyces sp. NPDC002564 TaxID=3364649 RepID=UPI00367DCEC1
MSSVLVVGHDPAALSGADAEAVLASLDKELVRFGERGIEAAVALVSCAPGAEATLVTALAEHPWDVVVVGGGIRKTEQLLPLFERIVNLIRRHAPQAAVAFNSGVDDSVAAAERWL